MKLQIAFDHTDLDKCIALAKDLEKYADIFEVGSLLIYKHGELAVKTFKEIFPQKIILADAKVTDRVKETITLFSQAGADWITVLAGAGKNVIHSACTVAHQQGKKVLLDLLDAQSLGQIALEAKSFGADALLFHKSSDEESISFLDRWDMVKGNTQLPIFITNQVTKENIADIIAVAPTGIIIGKSIIESDTPIEDGEYFSNLLKSI